MKFLVLPLLVLSICSVQIINAALPAAFIPLVKVGVDVALQQLDAIWQGDVIRSVKFAIENHSGKTLEARGSYSNSGSLSTEMPDIPDGMTGLLVWEKPRGSATGAIGILYYELGDKIVSLMASVPYDFNLYSSWANIRISDREESYYNLYKGKGGCAYPTKAGRWGNVNGIKFWLTNQGKASFKIIVSKDAAKF